MFDFLKPKFTDADLINLLDVESIKKQLYHARAKLETIIENYWSLGYIFGFLDGQTAYYHIKNQKQGFLAIEQATLRLFGDKILAYTALNAFANYAEDNQDFINGMNAAKDDRASFLLRKRTPEALYKYLSENNIKPMIILAVSLIKNQLVLAGVKPETIINDIWSIGYIYGFHDAELYEHGITNDAQYFALIARAAKSLFEDMNRTLTVTNIYLDQRNNTTFINGMTIGANDYFSFIDQEVKNSPPMALCKHFVKGNLNNMATYM